MSLLRLRSETTLGCEAADRAVVEGPDRRTITCRARKFKQQAVRKRISQPIWLCNEPDAKPVKPFAVNVAQRAHPSRSLIPLAFGDDGLGSRREVAQGLFSSSRAVSFFNAGKSRSPSLASSHGSITSMRIESSDTAMVPAALWPNPRIWKVSVSPLHTSCSIVI